MTVVPPKTPMHSGRRPGHRRDIQGLRALAVSLVVVYHLWPDRLTGGYVGVDVFFVISGFLITTHLVQAQPSHGRDLVVFWSRRVRRLLPAALLVLTATLVVSRLVASEDQWKNTAWDSIASALYVENWRLAGGAVDYLAADRAASPVQHFWSLSVEEQFYAFWPVLVLLAGLAARRLGRDRLTVTAVVVSGVLAASLAWSIHLTSVEPGRAYFVTTTRVWELAAGALLAVLVARSTEAGSRRSRPWAPVLRSALAWAGLAAIVWSAVMYSGTTPFPGYAALLPIAGTLAVLGTHARGVTPLLGLRAVQGLGDISYSVYLWHWPLIVLVPEVSGGSLGLLDSMAIIALTLMLATLTKTWVEDRFRRPGQGVPLRRPFIVAAVAMAIVVGLGSAQVAEVVHRQDDAADAVRAAQSRPCFGAAALAPGSRCDDVGSADVVPPPAQAVEDRSPAYADGCVAGRPFDRLLSCSYGDDDATTRIALIGNSHAVQWQPALDAAARQRGWRVTTYLVTECFPTDVDLAFDDPDNTEGCRSWGKKARAATSGDAFDLVVMAGFTGLEPARPAIGGDTDGQLVAAYQRTLSAWQVSGANVLVLKDTPYPKATIDAPPTCVAQHPDDLDACSARRSTWLIPDLLRDAAVRDDVHVADLTDYFCDTRCGAVVGGVVAYFDGGHMTATFSRTLAPYLGAEVERALDLSPRVARGGS